MSATTIQRPVLQRPMRPARRALALVAVAGAVMALGACTTIGTGTGSDRSGGAPVSFSWTSKDGGTTGTMTAALPDGTYSGPFVQLTSTVRTDALEPMWMGWRRGWSDWRYWGTWGSWGTMPDSGFATQYSGKVVANLQGAGDQHVRCRFHLNSPQAGMSGGGQGECQKADGSVVDAVFARG